MIRSSQNKACDPPEIVPLGVLLRACSHRSCPRRGGAGRACAAQRVAPLSAGGAGRPGGRAQYAGVGVRVLRRWAAGGHRLDVGAPVGGRGRPARARVDCVGA